MVRQESKPLHRLQPYRGEEIERVSQVGQSYVRHRFGDDRDGRTYRFNRLGYRGPEPDEKARRRIFAFGESHAFGYFVELEQSWSWRFVDLWCAHVGLDRSCVEYLNFADPGASNASIARQVVSQCSVRRPDIALVHFADVRRSEVLLDRRAHRIGPWLLEAAAADSARRAPGDLPATFFELIERGKAYFRHSLGREQDWAAPVADATCLLEALREILLVQSFCRAEGIRLVATLDRMEDLRAMAPQNHPILAPLIAALDDTSLCPFGIWSVDGDGDGDSSERSLAQPRRESGRSAHFLRKAPGHASPRRHGAFAEAIFDFYLHAGDDPPSLEQAPSEAEGDADIVRQFYLELPFNHFESVQAAAQSLRENLLPETYPDLHALLRSGEVRRVIDCGCGAGWLTNSLALHYGVEVVGLDMTARALERAEDVARSLGLGDRVRFVEADLHDARIEPGDFDLLTSLGVLHHTPDPRRAFERIRAWAPRLYIGLYHQPGRMPFLEHFRRLVEEHGEATARAELGRFGVGADREHLQSWFRDQVLHPRETSHTLREIVGWLDEASLELSSTSINRFRPIRRLDTLFRAEEKLEAKSRRAIRRRRFYPGFFTFLALDRRKLGARRHGRP